MHAPVAGFPGARCEARALKYLHGRKAKLIHRDVKPENVLLNHKLEAKLGDFGVARPIATTFEIATSKMTLTGTADYCCPSMASGQSYDQSVDVFSFGIMLLECISGKRTKNLLPSGVTNLMAYHIGKYRVKQVQTVYKRELETHRDTICTRLSLCASSRALGSGEATQSSKRGGRE